MSKHDLKILSEHFSAWVEGKKTFEIRKNDRDFKIGDTVTLSEWDLDSESFTGDWIQGRIKYITNFHQKKGFVVFSLGLRSKGAFG